MGCLSSRFLVDYLFGVAEACALKRERVCVCLCLHVWIECLLGLGVKASGLPRILSFEEVWGFQA